MQGIFNELETNNSALSHSAISLIRRMNSPMTSTLNNCLHNSLAGLLHRPRQLEARPIFAICARWCEHQSNVRPEVYD